ncbi:MAG: arginine deiminase family protein [Candidatus Marinimicrobia bacterium]|nr:arginine deiminase family protein [Candidatus Neomarinimicrobiota bacterium]
MKVDCQSMIGEIKHVLLKHPKDAYIDDDHLEDQWRSLNYLGPPDFSKSIADYDHFADLLHQFDVDVHFLPPAEKTGLDSIYTHDPAVITSRGAILCNMGKDQRQGEPEAMGEFLRQMDVPILGTITGDGNLEGGDVLWLDERTVAVGEGYRSNAEGIRQFGELLGNLVDEVISVPLPHWAGPADCLHLLSFISPVDHDLAVVYSRLMPVPFRDYLLNRGMRFVEVPDSEWDSMACNILAVAPRKIIMIDGNPMTRAVLEEEGVEVSVYDGSEISLKGAGGPTCLTRPVLRL